MKLAFLCAALVIGPAFADDLVARNGADEIRLADRPCVSAEVLTHLPAPLHSQFRAASALVQGHTFVACWRVQGNAAVLLYEDGDQGLVPLSSLKRALRA